MTKKSILTEIKDLKSKRDLLLEYHNDPEYQEAHKRLFDIINKIKKSRQPEVLEIREKINLLEKQLDKLDEEKSLEIPQKLQDWLKEYAGGCNWGPYPLEIIWHSIDERFVIVRWKGHTAWSGRGSQAYYPTTHFLVDTHKTKNYLSNNKYIMQYEGRLTKEIKQEMIEKTKQIK